MTNVLRLAIVDPNDSARDALKKMLLGLDMVWLEAECSRYEFFADVVAQTNPDIGMIAIDADPQKALDLVARLAAASARRQGVSHPARADRRPRGRAGTNQRSPLWP